MYVIIVKTKNNNENILTADQFYFKYDVQKFLNACILYMVDVLCSGNPDAFNHYFQE